MTTRFLIVASRPRARGKGSGSNGIVAAARKLRIRYSTCTLQLGGVVTQQAISFCVLAIVELSLAAERAGNPYLAGKLYDCEAGKEVPRLSGGHLETIMTRDDELEQPGTLFRHCFKCGTKSSGEMQICAKCRAAAYCSAECQREHWAMHRITCKEVGKKRDHRLFTQWVEQVSTDGALLHFCSNAMEETQLGNVYASRSPILLQVDFDFNQRTFKPVGPPEILLDNDKKQVVELQSGLGFEACPHFQTISVLIQYGSCYELAVPLTIPNQGVSARVLGPCNNTWHKILSIFDSISLSSSIFEKWDPQMQHANIAASLEKIKSQGEENFEKFLLHALHLPSKKPRHKTHVILVAADLGLGYGELHCLESFVVKPLDVALGGLQHGLSAEEVEQIKKEELNLGRRRSENPNCYYIPVLFLFKSPVHYIMPNLITFPKARKQWPPHKCDRIAAAAFEKLKLLPMPKVQSPDLNL